MSEQMIPMTAPPQVYRQRRARFAERLARPMVVAAGRAAAPVCPGNPFPFRASSNYLYLGGPPIEGAAWLVEPGGDGEAGCTLLWPPRTPDDIVWEGKPPADAAILAAAGLSRQKACVRPDGLNKLLAGRTAAVIAPMCVATLAWAAQLGLEQANDDERLAIINLRLVKDEHELAAMRRAAAVTIEGQRAVMAAVRPDRREADAAAAFASVLTAHECRSSFQPILTIRGEVLHAHGYCHRLQAGDLFLADAAAEEPTGYASDATRTYPVSGRWTATQRQIYDVVLRAQREAIAACRPGKRFREVHELAAHIICEGLVQAELLRGDAAELTERGAYALFFPHGLGHLVGLDVHDMREFGDLAGYAPGRTRPMRFGDSFLRLDRDLQPGMTVTIEPGIYFVPAIWQRDDLVRPFTDAVNRERVDALLADEFGGIRIEDTVCVRAAGDAEVLTADLPKDPDAVAALVGKAA